MKSLLSQTEYWLQILQTRTSDLAEHEFYVHYEGLDRRLDEWVSADRVDFDKKASRLNQKESISTYDELIDKADRKITRYKMKWI